MHFRYPFYNQVLNSDLTFPWSSPRTAPCSARAHLFFRLISATPAPIFVPKSAIKHWLFCCIWLCQAGGEGGCVWARVQGGKYTAMHCANRGEPGWPCCCALSTIFHKLFDAMQGWISRGLGALWAEPSLVCSGAPKLCLFLQAQVPSLFNLAQDCYWFTKQGRQVHRGNAQSTQVCLKQRTHAAIGSKNLEHKPHGYTVKAFEPKTSAGWRVCMVCTQCANLACAHCTSKQCAPHAQLPAACLVLEHLVVSIMHHPAQGAWCREGKGEARWSTMMPPTRGLEPSLTSAPCVLLVKQPLALCASIKSGKHCICLRAQAARIPLDNAHSWTSAASHKNDALLFYKFI